MSFFKISIIITCFFLVPISATAQNKLYQEVFTEIANSFGESKPLPELEIISKDKRCKIPAQYLPNKAVIQIEQCLIDITTKFGKDSTTALAILMGHELAHYYKEHEWCSEFAYSIRETDLGKKIIGISKDQRKINESQADDLGLYATTMAGYKPFEIYPKLIDAIYEFYELPQQLEGYPSKEERKVIATNALNKISNLYPVFLSGNFLFYKGNYQEASTCYEHLLKYFPSRENFNNLGVSKLLFVISEKDKIDLPFILPIEIDPKTRLIKLTLRSSIGNSDNLSERYLEEAKSHFNESIKKDKTYIEAYINYAICLLLQENYEGALGKINELELVSKNLSDKALSIKAIAYYLDQQQAKAIKIINQIEEESAGFHYNAEIIRKGYSFFESKIELIEWQETMIHTFQQRETRILTTTQKTTNLVMTDWVEFNENQQIGFSWQNSSPIIEIVTKGESWMLSVEEAPNDGKLTSGFEFKKEGIIEYISPQKVNIYTYHKKQ
jgi:tetratricopeptide (TPR) repeat protein